MNFQLEHSQIIKSATLQKMHIMQILNILRSLLLIAFALSLITFEIKLPAFMLAMYLIVLELSLFIKQKRLNTQLKVKLSQEILDSGNYNLAEFLTPNVAGFISDAIKFYKKRKIEHVNSAAIIYCAAKNNKEINLIFFRLGIDIKKFITDAKNYIEKTTSFSDDFENIIIESAKIAITRGKKQIEEKEILIAIAKYSEFFQKVLMDYDLKIKDVENLTLWFDFIEEKSQKVKEFWSYENLSSAGTEGKDWASGYTLNLDKYSIDWRAYAKKNVFRQIIGHQKEIKEVEIILARSSMANALIVGDPGTGRKSIVEAVAQRCYSGQNLPELYGKRVVELDMVALLSQVQDSEKLETILDQIFFEVENAGNVILVIDQLQNYVGLGQKVAKAGTFDISGILAKYLARPNFQFIGITDYAGLHQNIETNPSFLEYFRKVEIGEITEIETIEILQNIAIEAEVKNKITIIYPAIREIVNLTARYFPSAPFPKKAIDVLDESIVYAHANHEKIIMPHHIAKIISQKTQIPVGKMDFKEKEVLLNLDKLIHERIVNQSEAVEEISIAMRRARAGIGSTTRPMGSFLFLGPTGVGKTETAKALARIYFNGEDKMIRLDMSEFQAIADIPRLLGSVSPVEMQGLLTTPVRENPFSLVLLDEIEKAHPNILNLFLQVLDEGHITDGQGRKIIFTNTIIICTSNAGAQDIFKAIEAGKKVDKKELLDGIFDKQLFKPEFVNRFDATVIFHPLSKDNLLKIAQITLQSLQGKLKEKEIDFIITDNLKESIVNLSYKPEFGAREMRRVVQDKVENNIATALLQDKLPKGSKFEINPETFEVVINPVL